jgi:hypothetical protein
MKSQVQIRIINNLLNFDSKFNVEHVNESNVKNNISNLKINSKHLFSYVLQIYKWILCIKRD